MIISHDTWMFGINMGLGNYLISIKMKNCTFDILSLSKRTIPVLTAMLLLTSLFYSIQPEVTGLQGKCYVTVLNSEPIIHDIGIYEEGVEVHLVQTNQEYEYRIHLKDANTLLDIYEVRIELWLWDHKDTGTEINKKPDIAFIYLDEEMTSSLDGEFSQVEPKNGGDLDRIATSNILAEPMDRDGTWSFMVMISKANGCDRMQVKVIVTDGSHDDVTMVSDTYIIGDWTENYGLTNPASTVEGLDDVVSSPDGKPPDLSKLVLLALAGSVSCILTYKLVSDERSKLKTRGGNHIPRCRPS